MQTVSTASLPLWNENPGARCNAAGGEFRIAFSMPSDAPQSGTLASLFYYDRQSGSVERLSQLRAVLP